MDTGYFEMSAASFPGHTEQEVGDRCAGPCRWMGPVSVGSLSPGAGPVKCGCTGVFEGHWGSAFAVTLQRMHVQVAFPADGLQVDCVRCRAPPVKSEIS